MDLIFWRHAEAEDWTDGCDDLARSLTSRGEKQAKRMAGWLDRQLPEGTRIVCSPARRCEQTVLALGRKYKLRNELAPDTTADALLAAAGWPNGKCGADRRPPALAGTVDLVAAGPQAGRLPGAQGRRVVDSHARARWRCADRGGRGAVARTSLTRPHARALRVAPPAPCRGQHQWPGEAGSTVFPRGYSCFGRLCGHWRPRSVKMPGSFR